MNTQAIPQLIPPWQRVVDPCPRHPQVSMKLVDGLWRCPLCATGPMRPVPPAQPVSPVRRRSQSRPLLAPVEPYEQYMHARGYALPPLSCQRPANRMASLRRVSLTTLADDAQPCQPAWPQDAEWMATLERLHHEPDMGWLFDEPPALAPLPSGSLSVADRTAIRVTEPARETDALSALEMLASAPLDEETAEVPAYMRRKHEQKAS